MRSLPVAVLVLATLSSPARAAVDQCLVGSWIAETGGLTAFYRAVTPTPVTRVDGVIVMEIAADGTGSGTISEFEIEQPVGAARMINAGTGSFAFVINTSGTDFMVDMTQLSVNVKATMYASGAAPNLMADITQTLADTGPRSLAGTYTCTGAAMSLNSNRADQNMLPNWRRR